MVDDRFDVVVVCGRRGEKVGGGDLACARRTSRATLTDSLAQPITQSACRIFMLQCSRPTDIVQPHWEKRFDCGLRAMVLPHNIITTTQSCISIFVSLADLTSYL
jgi:hypothetical protein